LIRQAFNNKRDIVHLLCEYGVKVIAISRTKEDLEALKKETGCEVIEANLENGTNFFYLRRAADEAKAAAEKAGDVDFLVNNAGISILEPFLETKVENFEKVFNVNVKQVLIISQIIARKMVEKKFGAIVNISSQASFIALKNHTSYCTSKGALDQLTHMMALELGEYGIRVNSVNPTVTLTPMGEMAWSDPQKSAPMLSRIPVILNLFNKNRS
jgi:L-xylulose reductase